MFGSVETKVRPLRLAYVVDPGSGRQVRDAIRLSSSLWGGTFFPIILLHKRMPLSWREKPLRTPSAKSVILGYIDAFDPDILVQFSSNLPDFVRGTGLEVIKPGDIWKGVDRGLPRAPAFGLGIFELLNDIFEKHFRYRAKYPVRVVLPMLPRRHSLFWASLFGELPRAIAAAVERGYSEPLGIQPTEFDLSRLAELMSPDVLFPRRIVQCGLRPVRRSAVRRDASLFFMDASRVEDIADFWNLRAVGRSVLPVPKQLQTDLILRDLVISFLKAHRRPWPHNPAVCDFTSLIKARSCTMEEVKEFAASLTIDREPQDPSDSPFFALQHWYPRIWDSWARGKDGADPYDMYAPNEETSEVSDTETLKVRSRPLLPSFVGEYTYRSEPCCANEISFRVYGAQEYLAEVFPKAPGENLNRAISGMASFRPGWRIGRNGLVKLVKDNLTESRDIPAAETIMFAWLRDLGWKPQLSAPGLLAKQMYRQLGGNVRVLSRESLLGLFEHMSGGLVRQDGSPADQIKIGQERDLPVGEVKSRLGGSRAADLYGYLLSKGVFRLGLRLQCPHCLRHSWVEVDNLRATCTCPRCLQPFPAVGAVEGSTWSYKTAGPFSVPNYAEGAYSLLLTLEMFGDLKFHSLRTTPALSFTAEAPQKKRLEADFGLLWQDSLYGEATDGVMFGECKTYGLFEAADVERMRYLADTFPGAVIVFSPVNSRSVLIVAKNGC